MSYIFKIIFLKIINQKIFYFYKKIKKKLFSKIISTKAIIFTNLNFVSQFDIEFPNKEVMDF